MTRPPAVPLMVNLAGRDVVGIGGGRVAAAKLLSLARHHGAVVRVVAPRIDPELAEVCSWEAREYKGPSDLEGAALVVAATTDTATNERVAADAAAVGAWCVRTDVAQAGTAAIPATVRRGWLTIAVATDGRSPTVARWVRDQIEHDYGPEYAALTELLADLREDPDIRAILAPLDGQRRRAAWRSIPLVDILALLRSGSAESAKEVAAACLSSFSD